MVAVRLWARDLFDVTLCVFVGYFLDTSQYQDAGNADKD